MFKLLSIIIPNLGQIKTFFSKPFDKNNFIALCVIFILSTIGTIFFPEQMSALISNFELLAEAFEEAS